MKINTNKLFYFISFVVLCTIFLQVYWNNKNYIFNKERLKNEVQIAFDNTITSYFEIQAKEVYISVYSTDSLTKVEDLIKIATKEFKKSKSKKRKEKLKSISISDISSIKIVRGKKTLDSLGGLVEFPNKLSIAFLKSSVNYYQLDSLFKLELYRKNLDLQFQFKQFKDAKLLSVFPKKTEKFQNQINSLTTSLPKNESIKLNYNFSNITLVKRMAIALILSLLFSLSVIACLFFLLFIIRKQKKIDTIKNDFINNITHEFKTPITTIASALEGMTTFNPENDATKNQKYTVISFSQLQKLEYMVEKILETARFNSDQLQLNKELFNWILLLQTIVEKFKSITEKKIIFEHSDNEINFKGDTFYLENVVTNLLDNAIKYGGNKISVRCFANEKNIRIEVADNGNGIEKKYHKDIFEKFYRIPKGNIHDVKGYGIGLYYAKNIIEKHHGTLELLTSDTTNFVINLPNEN